MVSPAAALPGAGVAAGATAHWPSSYVSRHLVPDQAPTLGPDAPQLALILCCVQPSSLPLKRFKSTVLALSRPLVPAWRRLVGRLRPCQVWVAVLAGLRRSKARIPWRMSKAVPFIPASSSRQAGPESRTGAGRGAGHSGRRGNAPPDRQTPPFNAYSSNAARLPYVGLKPRRPSSLFFGACCDFACLPQVAKGRRGQLGRPALPDRVELVRQVQVVLLHQGLLQQPRQAGA